MSNSPPFSPLRVRLAKAEYNLAPLFAVFLVLGGRSLGFQPEEINSAVAILGVTSYVYHKVP